MKLIEILREIGEATAKPYPFDSEYTASDLDEYQFTTYSKDPKTGKEAPKNKYVVVIEKSDWVGKDGMWREVAFEVSFGLPVDPENQISAPVDTATEVNDPENMYRVIATVMAAIKKSIKQEESDDISKVTRISMAPTQRNEFDTRRTQFYKKYIEKHMPAGSNVYIAPDGSKIVITMPIK